MLYCYNHPRHAHPLISSNARVNQKLLITLIDTYSKLSLDILILRHVTTKIKSVNIHDMGGMDDIDGMVMLQLT